MPSGAPLRGALGEEETSYLNPVAYFLLVGALLFPVLVLTAPSSTFLEYLAVVASLYAAYAVAAVVLSFPLGVAVSATLEDEGTWT
jgi:hypothetical protein